MSVHPLLVFVLRSDERCCTVRWRVHGERSAVPMFIEIQTVRGLSAAGEDRGTSVDDQQKANPTIVRKHNQPYASVIRHGCVKRHQHKLRPPALLCVQPPVSGPQVLNW